MLLLKFLLQMNGICSSSRLCSFEIFGAIHCGIGLKLVCSFSLKNISWSVLLIHFSYNFLCNDSKVKYFYSDALPSEPPGKSFIYLVNIYWSLCWAWLDVFVFQVCPIILVIIRILQDYIVLYSLYSLTDSLGSYDPAR